MKLMRYDNGKCWSDPILCRFTTMDSLCELYYDKKNPYSYCADNPMRYGDWNGCNLSTHTDSLGNVVEVFNDGDLGVYKHDNDKEGTQEELAENYSSSDTSGGGTRMGETEYWDEFKMSNDPYEVARIYFGTSWDFYIERLNNEANGLGLARTAVMSVRGGKFDIKRRGVYVPDGSFTGRMLKGKYVTARSAGNFLAGMNGATGKIEGKYISLELYMRMAGALHSLENGTNPFRSPYYGEIPYAGRMIVAGFNYGVYKTVSKKWLAN